MMLYLLFKIDHQHRRVNRDSTRLVSSGSCSDHDHMMIDIESLPAATASAADISYVADALRTDVNTGNEYCNREKYLGLPSE
jgi:hypothetical protein